MNRDAFVRQIRSWGRKNGVTVEWNPSHGKGSHGRLKVGERSTTVPVGELKAPLVRAILKQLGLTKDALE